MESSKKRLFVGIAISQKLQQEIIKWRYGYMELLPIRWTKCENLHITLIPPWQDYPNRVISKLQSLKSIIPFKVNFSDITTGPKLKRPRLIWASGKDDPSILKLKSSLEKVLEQRKREENFFMHITLAKIFLPRKCPFEIKELQEKINWEEIIETVTLYESHLLKNGSQYDILYQKKIK